LREGRRHRTRPGLSGRTTPASSCTRTEATGHALILCGGVTLIGKRAPSFQPQFIFMRASEIVEIWRWAMLASPLNPLLYRKNEDLMATLLLSKLCFPIKTDIQSGFDALTCPISTTDNFPGLSRCLRPMIVIKKCLKSTQTFGLTH
jgi:hypothetical protein